MSNVNEKFYKIPMRYILESDEYEVLTYLGLLEARTLSDPNKVYISQKILCENMNYSSVDRRKGSYYSEIRKHLQLFTGRKWIKVDSRVDCENINPSECMNITLSDLYIPSDNYIKLTKDELDIIINNRKYRNRASLLQVFLYIKSFMYVDHKIANRSISAYYVVGNVAARALNISRGKYDVCVNVLCDIGLLICHQTGSYFNEYGISNAPNIYVYNNERARDNIDGALNRLRYKLLDSRYGNGEDFMPITHVGKAFGDDSQSDDTVSKYTESADNNNDDDGEWGDPNPMSHRSW